MAAPFLLQFDLCLHGGNISLDTDTQLQLPAQHPGSLAVIWLISSAQTVSSGRSAMQAIQVGSVVSQRVDLRLQRVMLHRQLRYAVDAGFPTGNRIAPDSGQTE